MTGAGNDSMKILVAHPAQQHSYRLATALKNAGILCKYATTVYYKRGSFTAMAAKGLKGQFRTKAENRRSPDLDDRQVVQFCEIEGLLKKLSELYTEVDEAVEIPKKMGFEDKGTFEIYQILKNELPAFDEALAREFANELSAKIQSRIYIGWQEVTQEYNRLLGEVALLAANEKYDALDVYGKDILQETIMDSIVRNFSLN